MTIQKPLLMMVSFLPLYIYVHKVFEYAIIVFERTSVTALYLYISQTQNFNQRKYYMGIILLKTR